MSRSCVGRVSGQNDQKEGIWGKDTERVLLPWDTAKGECKTKASSFVYLVACRPTRQNSPGARPLALDRLKVPYL